MMRGTFGRLLVTFGAASLAAVAAGAATCALSDVPTALWARNLVGWVIGAAAALGLAAAFRPLLFPAFLCLAPIGIAATFLGPEQSGVHRWLDVGPLSMNAAMLLLPGALVALAVLARGRIWPWLAAFAALALLILQPDASQATALAFAVGAVAVLAASRRALQLLIVSAAAVLAIAAWLRPDPLQPVPEVEGVVAMAIRVSPLLGGLALLTLVAVAVAPMLTARDAHLRTPALALSLCLAVWAVMPFFGAYPVPLVGVGLSPILGAWLGVGLLAGMARRPA